MKHKIYLAISILLVSSCVKLKKKDEPKNTESEPAIELSQRAENFSYSYFYNKSSKNYEIVFKIPKDWGESFSIEKSDENGKVLNQIKAAADTEGFWKDFLYEEKKINYKFFKKDHQKSELLDEVEILPVLDFSLREDLNIKQKYNLSGKTKVIYFKNLEISNQAHLYLEDFAGQIIIENLQSDSGFIQTFPFHMKAKNNMDGRSGGIIDLQILNGESHLNLITVGEAGGNGSDGAEPNASMVGEPGLNGAPAQFNLTRVENCTHQKLCIPKNYFSCVKRPEAGKIGSKGKAGHNGLDGKDGGRSGQFIVRSYASDLKINIYSQSSKKGQGGLGGIGGEGGRGGLGADGSYQDLAKQFNIDFNQPSTMQSFLITNQIENFCEAAKDGAQGLSGEKGKDGQSGQDGLNQKSILFLNDVKIPFSNEN